MLCTRKTGVTLKTRLHGDLLFIKDLCTVMVERFRITLTVNVNLYHVTTLASDQGFTLLYLALTVLYFYQKKIITFTLSSSIRIVLDCFFFTLISVLRNSQLESAV